MRTLRILVVTISPPLPANNGQRLRNSAMLQALAEEGHEVTLLVLARPGEAADYPALRAICKEVKTAPLGWKELSGGRDYFARALSSFSAIPHSVRRFASPEVAEEIALLLNSGSFDAAICEGVHAMVNFPRRPSIPLILDNHNVEYLLLDRYVARETNPVKRIYARSEAAKMRRWDRASCMRSALTLACSRYDAGELEALSPESDIAVAPNVIDIRDYRPGPGDDGRTVIYVGGMDWYPNRDAVQFFAADILPRLKQIRPDVRFLVAGRKGPEGFERQFQDVAGMEFTGTVADMKPYIAGAAVCVVPLRIGSGTRLKILEEAAMEKAIVSTPLGAEGLEFAAGAEIHLAEAPAQFAEAVAGLLQDAELRRQMGRAARRRVEREHGLAALRAALRPTLARIVERGDAAAGRKEIVSDAALA